MADTEIATLGGGCFWCLEAVYLDLAGVTKVTSGYAGGHVDNPTYEAVCGKHTGHAEVVQIEFNPAELAYEDLLRVFFTIHDPTTIDAQGNDHGPQYRSVIFTHSDAQQAAARQVMTEIDEAGIWGRNMVTQLQPLPRFWPAEPEHHNYFARNPYSGYCRAVVAPKVAKFRKSFSARLKAA